MRFLIAEKRPDGKNISLKNREEKDQDGFERIRRGYAPEGAKRRYEAHFISKLTDSDGENSETDTWLDFALNCGYLGQSDHLRLTTECRQIGSMLGSMLNKPEKFLLRKTDF